MSVRFTWDPAKAESNKRKHKIAFEEATRVFFDPFALYEEDQVEDGEYRSSMIGEAYGVILFVAYTYDHEEHETELIRIISVAVCGPTGKEAL